MTGPGEQGNLGSRPFLRVYFACANHYVRVYRAPEATCYVARCPACAATKTFRVGPGGTERRFFELSCTGRPGR
jgi:hypothetical protein